MEKLSSKRKLAAIMFTDIVGYTTVMNKDESAALLMLDKNRSVQKPLIEAHGGRLLKEIGDGILASFNSALDAVECANKIQNAVHNNMEFSIRIGIHLGDVTFQDNDVFGDGVNIASRLETIAPPGTTYISETVFQNIKNKPELLAEFVKEETLKNVQHPIKIYQIGKNRAVSEHIQTSENSIAVLPFVNMSNDPEQEYFADGLTEEILNSITQIKDLKVVGRTSSFQFKGKNIDLRDVGDKLSVSTVLEGSIRKQGTRIRITAQLINVEDGYHIWSERFDRELNDVFEIQDQIAMSVVERLKKDLGSGDRKAIKKRYTNDPEVLNQYLLAKFYYNKRTPDGFEKAIEILEEIIKDNPDFVPAYVTMADCYRFNLIGYGNIPREIALRNLNTLNKKALEIDSNLDSVHASLGHTKLMIEWDFKKSKEHLLKALEINPNNAEALQWFGWYYIGAMDYTMSSEYFKKALSYDPLSAILNTEAGWPYSYAGDLEKAKKFYEKAIEIDPSYAVPYFDLGNLLFHQGQAREGFKLLEKAIEMWGNLGFFLGVLGHFQAITGKIKKAEKTLEMLLKQHEQGLPVAFNIADIYEGMGKVKETLKWLNIAYEKKEVMIFLVWPWRAGHLQSFLLKDHPGLLEIMNKVGLPYS